MTEAISIGFLLGLTSALAVVLAIANAKWKVFEDPRVDDVHDMLPNSNCGACGQRCAGDQSCESGQCTCPTNQELCGARAKISLSCPTSTEPP